MIKIIIVSSILSVFFLGCATTNNKVNNINYTKNKDIDNKAKVPKSGIFKGIWKPINNTNIKFKKVVGV